MDFFDDKHIKNIVLLGNQKSGKTTLAESMLYQAGLIERRGTIEQNNTVSDYHAIEHEKDGSVHTTVLHTEWRNFKINILDSPGRNEFAGEIIPAVRIADTAVFVINAKAGIETGMELQWEYVDRFRKPSVFVINQVDHPNSNFEESFESLRQNFGNSVTMVQYPVNQGSGFNSIIDLLKMKMYVFDQEGGKPQKLPIPNAELEKANKLHNELVEKAAENDEGLMERFFEKGTLTEDEMSRGLRIGLIKHDVFPVFVLSALKDMGAGRLMGFIDKVAPSPQDALPETTSTGNRLTYKPDAPVELFVFKIQNEQNLGKMTLFKVVRGQLIEGMDLYNHQTGQMERLNNLFVMDGHKRTPVQKLTVGDIGASLKLKDTQVNHTLSDKQVSEDVMPMDFPAPGIDVAVTSSNPNAAEKISEALHKLVDEDPAISFGFSPETGQLILGVQGELHLSVVQWYLKNLYNLDLEFSKPRISYMETCTQRAEATFRHKKQSGGSGQFAEVKIRIEPYRSDAGDPEGLHIRDHQVLELDRGGKLEFYNCIVGGAIDLRFIPSIVKGILESLESGLRGGSCIRDIRVILLDGKMHTVDSNDLAFKTAAQNAFKEAFKAASPIVLEPVMNVEVDIPQGMMGDVITDLQGRRAGINAVETSGSRQVIKASVPQSEMYRYASTLQALSQGKAHFSQKFEQYQKVSETAFDKIAQELMPMEA